MKKYFIDSNIIVYANDCNAHQKQSAAINVISALMEKGGGVVSIQVLQEYANIAVSKLRQKVDIVLRQLKLLECLTVVVPTARMVGRSVEIQSTCQVSFWDAAIIAAAEQAECTVLLSEDLNEGQYYAGIQVVNPLREGFHFNTAFKS